MVPIVTAIAGIFIFVIRSQLNNPHKIPVKIPIKISRRVPAPRDDAIPIKTEERAIIEAA